MSERSERTIMTDPSDTLQPGPPPPGPGNPA